MPQMTSYPAKIREADVQRAILEYLRAKRVMCYRQNAGAFKIGDRFVSMGVVGIADIICLTHGGIYTAIEVKAPKNGVLSTPQVTFLRNVRKAGGIAMIATDVSDVIRLLDDRDAKSEEKYEKLLV